MAEQPNMMSEQEFLSEEIFRGIRLAKRLESSLGPNSRYKEIIDSTGHAVYTRDGATILKEVGATTPVEYEIKQLAEAMEDDPGDGTKRVVIFTGKLLEETIYLQNEKWLTTRDISRGYSWAAKVALEELDKLAIRDVSDSRYMSVITTSLSTKMDEAEKNYISGLVLKAYKIVSEGGRAPDVAGVHVIAMPGADLKESTLVENGIIVERKRRYKEMRNRVEGAKVALIEEGIPKQNKFSGANIAINFQKHEEGMLQKLEREIDTMNVKYVQDVVEKLGNADIVASKGMIDDTIQRALVERGTIVLEGVNPTEFERISRATGGKIVSKYSEVTNDSLGYAGLAECKSIPGRSEEQEHLFLEKCKNPKSVTLLLRGSTDEVAEELRRSYDDASKVLKSVMKNGKFVPSACATEAELAYRVREYAKTVKTEERWAIEAFADAFLYMPKLVARNAKDSKSAGLEAEIMLLAEHEKGNKYAGLDITAGDEIKVMDAVKEGHLEPARITERYIRLAAEYVTKKIMTDGVFVKKQ